MKAYFLLLFIFFGIKLVSGQTLEQAILERKSKTENQKDTLLRKTAKFSPFRWYKTYISSQDVPNTCRFAPSCSEYSRQAFKKAGIFIGILATFDRLSRCNGKQSPTFYVYDPEKKKFLDDFSDKSLP